MDLPGGATAPIETVREGLLGDDERVIGWMRDARVDELGDLAVALVELSTDPDVAVAGRAGSVLSTFVERCTSVGATRVDLVSLLAERAPALVVAHAPAWVRPDDGAVIVRLSAHHHRVAAAGAVRPWEPAAIRDVEIAAEQSGWHHAELDAVVRVMRDAAPELTHPSGVGDVDLSGRWRIMAERPWDWTLWQRDDGRCILERVEGGVGMWTSVHELSDDTAASLVAATIAGIESPGRHIAVRHDTGRQT
jgi:hypothetical protein